MKMKKTAAALGLSLFLLAAFSGCARQTADKPSLEGMESGGSLEETGAPAFEAETEKEPDRTTAPETKGRGEHPTPPGVETRADEDETEEEPRRSVQEKIVVATDLHYLAENLSGNRGRSFVMMAETGDGRVLQYGWEILDAFIEDMMEERPDLVVLTGDLTLNGERESHEELAEKLTALLEEDIPVIVIPGNHDINNPNARKYTTDGAETADSITAEDFKQIYSDFGYVAADSRDPYSLSYLYKLDSYYWLMMLDSCQYDPVNQVGGMIHNESYEWIEDQLEEAWEQGAQVVSLSHHNLLDQSGVSREFYDNCTIEHNEELIQRLADGMVRLHLSGHLHLQHHMTDEDSGISEVVTGSLVMAPCQYGVVSFWDDGAIEYQAKGVDVEGWAKEHSYRNRELAEFTAYSENFLRQVAYRNALLDLRQHTLERRVFFSDEKIDEMAKFYAELCVYYYGGRMYQIEDKMIKEKAYRYWKDIDYVSDLSDFLRNILDDDAKDFSYLELPYD